MKNISIIGTVGIPAKYGGFETLVEYLTINLNKNNDITVYCSAKKYDKKLATYNGANLKYIQLHANGFQSIPYDIVSILSSLRFADTILILGVSGCIVLPFVKMFSKTKIIVNIDGLEWKRNKWSKAIKAFLKFSEKLAVKYADVVVSDNKAVQEYVLNEYGVQSEFIAYGADHVTKETLTDTITAKYPFLRNKYAFKVCRIEPENNVQMILEVFRSFTEIPLVIIGNWNNSDYGKSLKQKFNHTKNIYLFDPIYDQNILNQIRANCYIYVHGHSAGGTNPSLVEAMYLGLPIFAFGVRYNKESTQFQAKYFNNKEDLLLLLHNICEEELKQMSTKLYNVAEENYTWKKISYKYENIF